MRNEPDLELGLIETMLVIEGAALELEAHIDRLAASARAVYGRRLPSGMRDAAADVASSWGAGPAGLQVALWPAGAELRYQCEIGLASRHGLGPAGPGLGLRPVQVEGGLGAHKWRDRGLIRRLGASLGANEELLILDGEEVLETGAGNLFACFEGTLVTPVADHRLLPGVTRARVIEIAGHAGWTVEERYLGLAELGDAQEVFVTSSVRGIVPVTEWGAIRSDLGEETRMLRAALAERWSTQQSGVTREKGRGGTCIRSLGGAAGTGD